MVLNKLFLCFSFFALLVVYLIAGMAFNKVKLQAQGKDVVPNVGFWSALPGLIKVRHTNINAYTYKTNMLYTELC